MASVYTYHYSDVVMSATASKITGVSIVYSTVYWGADQIKYQCSVSLAFMRGIPVQRASNAEMFSFDDVINILHNCVIGTVPVK